MFDLKRKSRSLGSTAQKMKFSVTEEIINGKLHFLCSEEDKIHEDISEAATV